MCIISFHIKEHPTYKLILLANRDEFYARPTREAHFWEDDPSLLAGRDLKANGTWLGITKQGRFAALTNFRDPNQEQKNKQSRGGIVTHFLKSNLTAPVILQHMQQKRDTYNGFNLLAGTVDELFYYSKQDNDIIQLTSGTHSVSNAALNTPWPKVEKARQALHQYVHEHEAFDLDHLFSQLRDDEIAKDELLPSTGLDLELERQVSPIFITSENYGTRSSTILLVTHDNEVSFTERTFEKGIFLKDRQFSFVLNE